MDKRCRSVQICLCCIVFSVEKMFSYLKGIVATGRSEVILLYRKTAPGAARLLVFHTDISAETKLQYMFELTLVLYQVQP